MAKEPGKHYYIVTVLQYPRYFKSMVPAILLKDYLDAYYRTAGENCGLDRNIFTQYLFDRLELLLPSFNQQLLKYRNLDFKRDSNKVICVSLIPLGRNIPALSQQLATAFCEEFIKLPDVFGSGVIVEIV